MHRVQDVGYDILQGLYDLTTESYLALAKTVVDTVGLSTTRPPGTHLRSFGDTEILMKDLDTISELASTVAQHLPKLNVLLHYYLIFGLKPKQWKVLEDHDYPTPDWALARATHTHLQHKTELFKVLDWESFRASAILGGTPRDLNYALYEITLKRKKNVRKTKPLLNLYIINYEVQVIENMTDYYKQRRVVQNYYEMGGTIFVNGEVVTSLRQLFTIARNIYVTSHWYAVGLENLKSICLSKDAMFDPNAMVKVELLNPKIEYFKEGHSGNKYPLEYQGFTFIHSSGKHAQKVKTRRFAEREAYRSEDEDLEQLEFDQYDEYLEAKQLEEHLLLTGQSFDLFTQCEVINSQRLMPMFHIDRTTQSIKVNLHTFMLAHNLLDEGYTEEDIREIAANAGVELE